MVDMVTLILTELKAHSEPLTWVCCSYIAVRTPKDMIGSLDDMGECRLS